MALASFSKPVPQMTDAELNTLRFETLKAMAQVVNDECARRVRESLPSDPQQAQAKPSSLVDRLKLV
jgi:hypothetical protein